MVRIVKQSPANDVKRNNEGSGGGDSEDNSSVHKELLCLLVPVCQGKSTRIGRRS